MVNDYWVLDLKFKYVFVNYVDLELGIEWVNFVEVEVLEVDKNYLLFKDVKFLKKEDL